MANPEYNPENDVCLNADRTAIVPCDSPQAHFKLTPPFDGLSDEEAEALGLSKVPVVAEPEVVEMGTPAEPEEKAQPVAPANKAVAAAQNKGAVKK